MRTFRTNAVCCLPVRVSQTRRDPAPDAAPWRAIADRGERLRVGLRAVYDWYARNESLTACVLRDAQHHALTREINELWAGRGLRGLARGAGREAERKAARAGRARAQLLHLADAGARERTETGRSRRRDGSGDRKPAGEG
jgi:hypothetical protein